MLYRSNLYCNKHSVTVLLPIAKTGNFNACVGKQKKRGGGGGWEGKGLNEFLISNQFLSLTLYLVHNVIILYQNVGDKLVMTKFDTFFCYERP